jgi:hypothetical protein
MIRTAFAKINTCASVRRVMLSVDGQTRPFIVDTGSDGSFITQQPKTPLQPFSQAVTAANGEKIIVLGKANLNCTAGTNLIQHEFIVAPHLTDNILGIDFLNKYHGTISFRDKCLKTSIGILPLLTDEDKGLSKVANVAENEPMSEAPSVAALGLATDWKAKQKADPILRQVMGWVKRSERPSWDRISRGSYYLRSLWCNFHSLNEFEGVLVREVQMGVDMLRQIVIPRLEINNLLETLNLQGNPDYSKCVTVVREKHFWPGWINDLKRAVSSWLCQ